MDTEKGPKWNEGQAGQEDRRAIEGQDNYDNLTDQEKIRINELQARPYRGMMMTRGDAMEIVFLERKAEPRIDELVKQGVDPREARRKIFAEDGLEE